MPDSKKRKHLNFLTSLIFSVALFFFILTFSIGLTIYFRPFYYAHIDALSLPEKSGFTEEEIKTAYDDVLDYLTIPGKDFAAGNLAFSEEGKAHFSDCKALFSLNAYVFLFSASTLAILTFLKKRGSLFPFYIGKRSAAFFAAISAIFLPLITGVLAATNFDRAFIVFHKIFFPGKENWIFNPRTDEIIKVLPQEFFMNCAILIGACIIAFSTSIIICEKKRKTH